MLPTVRYLITQASNDSTVSTGDIVSVRQDGALILHNNGGGWVQPEDVGTGLEGAKYVVDPGYIPALESRIQHWQELLGRARLEEAHLAEPDQRH